MDVNQRIAQWENMTQSDPGNGMGWFSLGTAYKDAERWEDAATALRRAIDADQGMSRAYQMLGQVLMKLERPDEAADVLRQGYAIAAQRGDVMPEKAMAQLLTEKLGHPLPEVERQQPEPAAEQASGDQVLDRRTGRMGPRLPDPPMRGDLGLFIYDHYSQETWREWIGMGTKVINELRLDFSNPAHQDVYEQHMLEWLGVSPDEVKQYAADAGGRERQ